MNMTVVCSHCRNHDKDPNIEINFKDGKVYYLCPECNKESKISLVCSLSQTQLNNPYL